MRKNLCKYFKQKETARDGRSQKAYLVTYITRGPALATQQYYIAKSVWRWIETGGEKSKQRENKFRSEETERKKIDSDSFLLLLPVYHTHIQSVFCRFFKSCTRVCVFCCCVLRFVLVKYQVFTHKNIYPTDDISRCTDESAACCSNALAQHNKIVNIFSNLLLLLLLFFLTEAARSERITPPKYIFFELTYNTYLLIH